MSGITSTRDMDTFPKLLLHHVQARPQKTAMREKDLGIWQSWSWAEMKEEIFALAGGLASLGLKRGDTLAIVGDNRPQMYWTMVAAQCLGATPVPMYQDSVAEEMQYVLDHAEARIAVVEDQEQVDKLQEIMDRCPHLETVVYEDERGMRHYKADHLHAFAAVQEKGRAFNAKNPGFLDKEIAACKGADIGIMLYTSGTTGKPKGVMLSNDNVLITARNASALEGLDDSEETVAYLPMAWVGDHIFSLAQAYVCGYTVNCPESGDTVMTDMREIGPTYYFAPPRIYENLLTSVMIRMEDAAPLKRKMFHHFMDVAQRVGTKILDGKPVSAGDRFQYWLGNILVYGPLKNVLGLSRLKLAYTAGEAIGPEIFEFYRSLGINAKQLYGQTEGSVFVCIQPNGAIKSDTVGLPAPEVELKIDDNGEVHYRGPGVFVGYYKNEDGTRDTKDAEDWVATGDAGFFDDDGQLKIIDRAKDVGKMTNGGMFPPKYLENKLKFFPYIKEAVAFGHERDYVTAFINIDLEAVGNWAERKGLPYSGFQDLAARPEVYGLIEECVRKVNESLKADPMLSHCQIRRFLNLHKELDADDGELTRTRKVRRRFIAERYGDQIEALYSGVREVRAETEVTFEDGRKGVLKADLTISDVAGFEATQPAATGLRKTA
jgi:long-chain acyl-CoA synthetase